MPTSIMTLTEREAPKRMMATFKIFLETNLRAGLIQSGWKKLLMMVPEKRAMIEAPRSPPGISSSIKTENPATAAQMTRPRANKPFFFALESIF